MFACARCDNMSSDVATCSICKRHFDFQCAGITETGFRKLGDRRNTWRCPDCRSGSTSSLPTPKESENPSSSVPIDKVQFKLDAIMKQLAPLEALLEDVRSIKHDLATLQKSVEFAHDSIKEYSDSLKSLETKVKVLEERTDIIPALQASITKIENNLRVKEQWARMGNVEIKGIPIKNDENLYDIALKVGEAVGCPIQKTDINFIARIPTQRTDAPKPIIVSLNNRYLKEDLVAAARARKDLNLKSLGYTEAGKYFVNDHLTTFNKSLLSKAKATAKEKNFQFIWVKHCKILARKSTTSKIFTIKTEADLQRIV
ncbi:hypothetical protein ABMA27_000661 [Loxostege sticticalis]|uniref:FP protein C-terminal domain-containing protein n=1 Tax=Loxostege sticticalis TaxID=481309 RepID=A0ABR3HZW7_LOXSC